MSQPTNLLFEVWRLARRTGSLIDAEITSTGLTSSDFGLYSAIHLWGPVTPTELARRSGAPMTTVSEALRRLERRGHVERSAHPDDGRSITVALSPAGREVHQAAGQAFEGLLGRVQAMLGTAADPILLAVSRLNRTLAAIAGEGEDEAQVEGEDLPHRNVPYHGEPLTGTERDEVRRYIDWLRYRRTAAR